MTKYALAQEIMKAFDQGRTAARLGRPEAAPYAKKHLVAAWLRGYRF